MHQHTHAQSCRIPANYFARHSTLAATDYLFHRLFSFVRMFLQANDVAF
jgi:hypothetical protein